MLTKVLPVKFTEEQYNDLKQMAEMLDVPMSQIVREATLKRVKKTQKAD